MKKVTALFWGIGIGVVIAIAVGFVWNSGTGQPQQNNNGSSIATSTSLQTATITYTNNTFGFTFSLPADWQGYSIVTSTWQGNEDTACPGASGCPPITGPEISIRNPNWTPTDHWQDIPIMVFTSSEWNAVASETLAVSAAPIPPSELGENKNYVFALPARYNYAYPNGWQEVQSIIQSNPLHTFNVTPTED